MGVRPARTDDLDAMLDLAQAKREQYRHYAPVFHRPAATARATRPFGDPQSTSGRLPAS